MRQGMEGLQFGRVLLCNVNHQGGIELSLEKAYVPK